MTDEPREPTPEELEAERLAALEEGVGKVTAETKFEEPPDTSEIDAMVQRRKEARAAAEKKSETEQASSRSANRGAGIGMTIAWAILIIPMIGLGLGWLVDNATDSNVFRLIGFLIGAVIAVGYAIRASARA